MSDLFRQAMLASAMQQHAHAVAELQMMIAVNQLRASQGKEPKYDEERLERACDVIGHSTINPHSFD